jgi:nitrite reductase/ring-hydroxylating ferredoxin subunit
MIFLQISCAKNNKYENPYLEDIGFSIQVNMDLPEYSQLKFANNSVLVHNIGIKGVIIFYSGSTYVAYEASDPNHFPTTCSQMVPNQFTCKCTCEENKYSLYDGQVISGEGQYPMKPYHITQNGNMLRIYN